MFEIVEEWLAIIYCLGLIATGLMIPSIENIAKERMPFYVQVIFIVLWPVVWYGSYQHAKEKRNGNTTHKN